MDLSFWLMYDESLTRSVQVTKHDAYMNVHSRAIDWHGSYFWPQHLEPKKTFKTIEMFHNFDWNLCDIDDLEQSFLLNPFLSFLPLGRNAIGMPMLSSSSWHLILHKIHDFLTESSKYRFWVSFSRHTIMTRRIWCQEM